MLGDYSNSLKEIKTLGDLEQLNDPLVLTLATKLLDLPVHKRTRFLERAALRALTKDERHFAEFELARHLSNCGKRDEALRKVDSVIAQLTEEGGHGGLRTNAVLVRWDISNDEQDFRVAKSELEKYADLEHCYHLAALLIDHGDNDEAERILSDALADGDPEAQLIIIDARIRANRIESARHLLLSIAPDNVIPNLQHPYAVAYALVALACADDDLKRVAAARLRNLPATGTRLAKHVNDFLDELEGQQKRRRNVLVTNLHDFFFRRS
jgi:tetratricopeptide (TPR) repeat protein